MELCASDRLIGSPTCPPLAITRSKAQERAPAYTHAIDRLELYDSGRSHANQSINESSTHPLTHSLTHSLTTKADRVLLLRRQWPTLPIACSQTGQRRIGSHLSINFISTVSLFAIQAYPLSTLSPHLHSLVSIRHATTSLSSISSTR